MSGSNGEICYISNTNSPTLVGFSAAGQTTPQYITSPANVTMTSVERINGSLICRYTRSEASSHDKQRNIDAELEVLVAYGNLQPSGAIQYHGQNNYKKLGAHNIGAFVPVTTAAPSTTLAPTTTSAPTSTAESVTSSSNMTTQMASSTTTKPQTTQVGGSTKGKNATSMMAESTTKIVPTTLAVVELTSAMCGKSRGCYRTPDNCTTSSNCRTFITWEVNKADNTVDIEFSGKTKGWIAVGLNDKPRMVGTIGQICYMNGSNIIISNFDAQAKAFPKITESMKINSRGLRSVNGALICRFKRPIAKFAEQRPLNQEWHLVMAWGSIGSGGVIEKHPNKGYHWSSKKVLIAQTTAPGSGSFRVVGASSIIWIGIIAVLTTLF